jgi:SAM-dependent methyltransferase
LSERPSPLVEALQSQERAWHERPLVRSLYDEWYRLISERLSAVPGDSVELGSGIATLQRVCPQVRSTDVERTPWTDEVVDAEALPYAEESLANLVLVDVFHHLARPAAFLDEAERTLAPGGRAVVLDPYCSPVSTRLYRLFHHERTDLAAAPFAEDETIEADPLSSNQARATLVFFRHADELARRWPRLALVERRRLALLAYPLSGGFTGRPLVPPRLGLALQRLEPHLSQLARLLAFRCLVVLERRPAA